MASGYVQVATDGTGKQLANEVVTYPYGTTVVDGAGNPFTTNFQLYLFREHIINADPSNPAGLATVRNDVSSYPGDFGLTVRAPAFQPDNVTILNLLNSIDQTLSQLAGVPTLFGNIPAAPQAPAPQLALPSVGIAPSQLSPTVPRPVVCDTFGRQIVVPYSSREALLRTQITITSTTAAQTLIAAGGDTSTFNDIVGIVITNTSATGTEVDISDGTQTLPFFCPATDTRGLTSGVMIPATKTNTAWTATTI